SPGGLKPVVREALLYLHRDCASPLRRHCVHRIRNCVRGTKWPCSPGGVVFFHSQHRRPRLGVHPFCFCLRSSSLSMIRRTSSATKIPFSLEIFSKAACCGFQRYLFVRRPCCMTYTHLSRFPRTILAD